MPDMDFAGGLLNSFFKTAIDEKHRRDTNNLDAANYLLQSGRIRDVNELLPLFGDAGKTLQKNAGKAGSPAAMLGTLVNPILKKNGQGGGGGGATGDVVNAGGGSPQSAPPGAEGAPAPQPIIPSAAAAPAQRPSLFKTDAEMRAEKNAQADIDSQRKITEAQAIANPKLAATAANTAANVGGRVKVAEINAGTRGTDLHKAYNGAIAAFTETNGRPPTDTEASDIMMKTRADWQAAGRKVTDAEAITKSWLADAKAANGGADLSPQQEKVERLKALKAIALAKQTETPGEKLSRAESLAKFKEGLTAFTPQDLRGLSQTATIGDSQTSYLDTSGFTGKEKAKAMTTAMAAGIIPVTAKQAEQLEAATAAAANLKGFADQITSKLPKDASGRPIASLENKLSQYFQTDEDLASAVSWDTSVLPLLRAMQVGGRITNLEFQTALNARPKITDTLGTVQKKLAIVNAQLKNGTAPILQRGAAAAAGGEGGGGGTGTPPAAKPAATSPDEQAKLSAPARLKDANLRTKARQILLGHGRVANDETIDQFLKKNNDALINDALKALTTAHKPAA